MASFKQCKTLSKFSLLLNCSVFLKLTNFKDSVFDNYIYYYYLLIKLHFYHQQNMVQNLLKWLFWKSFNLDIMQNILFG